MMPFNRPSGKKRTLILFCIAISMVLHGVGLYIFYKNPLILQSSLGSLFKRSPTNPHQLLVEDAITVKEKNKALIETFSHLEKPAQYSQKPYDLDYNLNALQTHPHAEKASGIELPHMRQESTIHNELDQAFSTRPSLVFPEDSLDPLSEEKNPAIPFVSQIEIDKKPSLDIVREFSHVNPVFEQEFDDLGSFSLGGEAVASAEAPSDSIPFLDYPNVTQKNNGQNYALNIDPSRSLGGMPLQDLDIEQEPPSPEHLFLAKPPKESENKHAIKPVASLKKIPKTDSYAFTEKEKALDWDDGDCEVSVQLMPHPEGGGYLFSLNLIPHLEMPANPIKQNFYFLIDRSNSIEKHRYNVFKRAVLRAISHLQEGNYFNIYIFDRDCVRLNEKNLPYNSRSLRMAEEFLEAQEHKSHFSAAEIYASLDKIIPSSVKDEDSNTAILISDGNTLLDARKQQKLLNSWIKKNNGRVNLYTAAVGKDNNLILLDLLSSFNRGKLLYSETHASFPRKLSKLVMSLSNPLAKDLIVSVVPKDPKATITFHPTDSRLPTLFKDRPLTLLGTIDRICDFNLYIQGFHKGEELNVKIPISFEEAKKGTASLEKQWALYRANTCYEKFLKEGKGSHLKEAHELMQKAGGEIAFE